MRDNNHFDFQHFRKWMEQNEEIQNPCSFEKKNLSDEVEPKPGIGVKHLAFRIQPEDGDSLVLAKEFLNHGGKLLDVDGKLCLVEVNSGSFFISKSCCRRKDD